MFRRAKFIWTSKQAIDGAAAFRVFIGPVTRRDEGKNRWFLFRRRLTLPSAPDEASLSLTVDGRYQLFVNGARLGRGPVRCSPSYQRFDTYDVAPHLVAGENVIAVLVHVYGVDTSWYETVKGEWQAVFGDGALWCEGRARCGAESREIGSDLEWRVSECGAWQSDAPRVNWGLGFVEDHDARRMPEGWNEVGFDDSSWDPVHELVFGGGPPDGMLGGFAIEPFPTLLPRQIPFLSESPLFPERMLYAAAVVPQPDLPLEKRIFEEQFEPVRDGMVDGAAALLRAGGAVAVVRTSPDRDVALFLDFGRIHSGHPFIEMEARGGEVVEIAVAEGAPGEWQSPAPERLRLTRDAGHGANVVRYTARPGVQRFEKFEWAGVRYAQVNVRNAPDGLQIREVGSTYTRYPAEERGRFECSDPFLERLWQVGRYTLQLCMHDGWEDCPGREQRQWLGDATVEFLVGQAAFGPSVNALNRQFLRHAAESQRPDGLTQMFAPGDHRTNAILIPDWTLQWILNAEQHLLYAGESDVIEDIFPGVQRALAWFERQIGPHGVIADMPHWHFHDWAALGRRGEAATLNAVFVGALRAAAAMARALESERAARRYDALAASVGMALERHWDDERGVYLDTLDPGGGTPHLDRRVSQHANAAMILWDIAPRERWPSMIAYMTDPARLRFTAAPPIVPRGEDFDPETDVVLANTFFSHFVYRALCHAGRFDLVLALIRERYGRMLERGATTLWESYDPTASLCHGFSATPVFQLSAEVLGVTPMAAGFRRFRVAPQLADLEKARGVFPTVRGDVFVSWKREDGLLRLAITVPDDTEGEVTVPEQFGGGTRTLSPGTHRLECGA